MRDFDLQPAADIDLPPGKRRAASRREAGHLDSLAHCVGGLAARLYLRLRHRLRVEGKRAPTRRAAVRDGLEPREPPRYRCAR